MKYRYAPVIDQHCLCFSPLCNAILHGITFSGWRKCERHVACHSNGELPRLFSTLEWRATLFAGINWKIMMPGSISLP
ncbi:MAG: hypothetical protein ACI9DF_002443 [Verrucomicrobiales bacterium]|jgi:hypothetical protein